MNTSQWPKWPDLVEPNPLRINFLNNYGDSATFFSLDQYTCKSDVTFRIYDKDENLVISEALPNDCFNFEPYGWTLTNGISAIEWVHSSGVLEGWTAIDNVELCSASALTDTIINTDAFAKEKAPPLKNKDSMSSKNFKVKPIDDFIPEPTKQNIFSTGRA